MALFYSDKIAKKSAKSTALRTFHIQDLDYQGLGVAKADGKIWFVENALPNERVEAKVIEEKRQYGRAQAVKFEQKSAIRQTPDCVYYAKCGGCQMQHIPLELQRNTKQKALFQRLQKLQSKPIVQQPMIIGEDKGYRRRAKLSIRFEKELPIIGFRQEQSQQVVRSHIAQYWRLSFQRCFCNCNSCLPDGRIKSSSVILSWFKPTTARRCYYAMSVSYIR